MTAAGTVARNPPASFSRTPRPLRVVMLIDVIDEGASGAERLLVALATRLPRDRFRVSVCTTRHASGPLVAELASAGVPVCDLDRRSRLDVPRLARLSRVLGGRGCDVLHAHMFGSNVWAAAIGRACRVPVILAHEHGSPARGRPLQRTLEGRFVAPLVTRLISVCEPDRERMVRVARVPPAKAAVMPNPYVPRAAGTRSLRQELGIADGRPIVGSVATMRPEKALGVLVRAHALLLQRHPSATLVLAGDGPCRREVEDEIEALGLGERVRLLGMRDDVGGILAGLDVAAISSDREGMPLFALECMASGVPLVATDVGGLHELGANESAALVPPRDPGALAAAIGDLLDDPGRRTRLAERARHRVRGRHIDEVVSSWASLYEELSWQRR